MKDLRARFIRPGDRDGAKCSMQRSALTPRAAMGAKGGA